MVYARKKHGGASCYLIAPDNIAAFIRYETWAQGVANCFRMGMRWVKGGESVYLILLLLLLPVQILIEILKLNK